MSEHIIKRAASGLTIHVDGDHLVILKPKNHLGMGEDARHAITDGPAVIGDRWYARSVRQVVADDGGQWLVGYGATLPDHCTFGSCPDGHAVAWRVRTGESWTNYA